LKKLERMKENIGINIGVEYWSIKDVIVQSYLIDYLMLKLQKEHGKQAKVIGDIERRIGKNYDRGIGSINGNIKKKDVYMINFGENNNAIGLGKGD